jgi:hypothetical protein
VAAIGRPSARAKQPPIIRPDPAPRNLDGALGWMALENEDPNRHYVWVARNKLTLNEYRRMGYVPEVQRQGGVAVAGEESPREGAEVEACDHVLMSVSKDRAEDIQERGPWGATGQHLADVIEQKIVDRRKGAVMDHFRGLGVERHGRSPYFAVENETTHLEQEI